jgi:pimeloyl-ACP methyl ester carboxylesterase
MNWVRTIFLISVLLGANARAGVRFSVRLDPSASPQPVTGRVVVFVKRSNQKPAPPTPYLNGAEDFFGADAVDLKPGDAVNVNDRATAYPCKLSELPPGNYAAQAMLDMHQDDSNWRREPGNLFSDVVAFRVSESDASIDLPLPHVVQPIKHATTQSAQIFEMRSKLLSDFHHRDISLRAGVLFPREFDPSQKYPAIYRIPGSGGDGISILDHPESAFVKGPANDELAKSAFVIWLDPESGNGHTLFANSNNNGPRGDAVVQELIPALEAKFPVLSRADARIVMGHSSGGWAALWLELQYPEIFGACFAISPDPVDFHCLELIDIYNMKSAYTDGTREFPGSRSPGAKSVRQENQIEEVLGPHNSSGQDWDAWQACWGRRDSDGHVASLFDPITGAIDHDEAESWRRYDITDLLRRNPGRYAPIFHQRVRLIVGDRDTFFLNDGVAKLKEELDKHPSDDTTGYIRILPAYDHGSILNAPEVQAWSQEMLDWLRRTKPQR